MDISKRTLDSGLRIITIPEADAMAATVLVLVEAGSKYEDASISGLSHFLEHMCFKGTTNRPRSLLISSELDSLGAQFNAFTSHEFTGYYAKVQPKHVMQALDIVADLYVNPLFESSEIEKEKGVIIEEINMYEDLPHRKVAELLLELVYGDQPAGRPVSGSKEVILSATRDHFLLYRADHYVPSATVVIVAGKFDEEPVLNEISRLFSGLPQHEKKGKPSVIDTQDAPRVRIMRKQSDQTHLVLGIRSLPLLHPDRYVLELLAGVLGGGMSSRLFERVREQMGAAYYIRANQDGYTDHGLFEIAAGVDHRKLSDVVGAIIDEVRRIKEEFLLPEELSRAKESILGHLYLGLEKSDEIAQFYGVQEVLSRELKKPEDVAAGISAVTASDIKRLAGELFTPERANLALIGPGGDEQAFIKQLELL